MTKRERVPDWTSEEIIKVRKIYRQGGTLKDVMEVLQTPLHREAVRSRAISLGMRFTSTPKTYDGTSKASQTDNP
jgi:hypothetical protein